LENSHTNLFAIKVGFGRLWPVLVVVWVDVRVDVRVGCHPHREASAEKVDSGS
jgi:uncharacterized protein (DUF302 family)